MNKAIEKLINYLNNTNFNIETWINLKKFFSVKGIDKLNKMCVDAVNQRKNFIRYLTLPKEEWNKYGEIFTNFDELSILLVNSNLKIKIKEKLEVIIYIMQRNIYTGILLDNNLISKNYVNMRLLRQYPFKYNNVEEVVKLLNTEKSTEIMSTSIDELNEKDKEVVKAITNSLNDIEPLSNIHKIIKEHLIDKLPNIDNEDVRLSLIELNKLEMDKNLLNELEEYLNILVSKKKKDNQVIPKVNHEVRTYLSNKELKMLNRELSQYYDIDNDKAIRVLTLSEELYVIYLMQKLDFNKKEMTSILDKINHLSNINPVILYARLYDKYNLYSDDEKVKNILMTLESYFQNMFMCDRVEYTITKMCFEDEFKKLLLSIPSDYEYEYDNAKKLIKK